LVKLLRQAEKAADWLPDFLVWGVHSGMRRGEILALTWGDLGSIKNGRLLVQIKKSKTDQFRNVECTAEMMEILERQKERKIASSEAVFPVSPMTLRRRWEKARELADLRDVTIRDLRRTHATYAITAGVDMKTVADRIGHADLGMLQKHYAAFQDGAQAQAAKTIQATVAEMMEQGRNAEETPPVRATAPTGKNNGA